MLRSQGNGYASAAHVPGQEYFFAGAEHGVKRDLWLARIFTSVGTAWLGRYRAVPASLVNFSWQFGSK